MRVKMDYNKTCIFLGVCWLFLEQGFYLLPEKIGLVSLRDIAVLLLVGYQLWFYLRRPALPRCKGDRFVLLGFSFLLLVLIAAVMAYFHWDQGFLSSILPQRYLIAIFPLYFPLKSAIQEGKVSSQQLLSGILLLGKVELVVMMVQFFAQFSGVYFLTCDYNSAMYTFTRFGIDGTTMLFVMFYEISNLFRRGKKTVRSLLWIGMGCVFFFLMCQTRMTLLGICAAVAIFYLTLKTGIRKKMAVTLVMGLAAIAVFHTTLFQDTIYIRQSGARNTFDIRQSAISFYLDELKESPVFGKGGYPNSVRANLDRGKSAGYNLNDNGIFGFLYLYGMPGALWAGGMYWIMLKKGRKAIRQKENSVYLMFPVYLLAVSATEIHWYWIGSTALTTVLFWLILQHPSALNSRPHQVHPGSFPNSSDLPETVTGKERRDFSEGGSF